jgi:hypothetical protein
MKNKTEYNPLVFISNHQYLEDFTKNKLKPYENELNYS